MFIAELKITHHTKTVVVVAIIGVVVVPVRHGTVVRRVVPAAATFIAVVRAVGIPTPYNFVVYPLLK